MGEGVDLRLQRAARIGGEKPAGIMDGADKIPAAAGEAGKPSVGKLRQPVRNDRLKSDFEILLDVRRYSDVIKTRPREVR